MLILPCDGNRNNDDIRVVPFELIDPIAVIWDVVILHNSKLEI